LAAVPLQSIAFLLGGVAPIELLLSQALLLVAAVVFAMYGLFVSSRMKTTLSASVVTFAGSLFFTVGLPVAVLIFGSVLGPLLFGASSLSSLAEMALVYTGLLLAATNLPATLIVSDVFLLQEDALFFYKESFGSYTAYLFSPWWVFLLLYILLAMLLYWLTVRRIRKIADK
jgi:hypothetical protein